MGRQGIPGEGLRTAGGGAVSMAKTCGVRRRAGLTMNRGAALAMPVIDLAEVYHHPWILSVRFGATGERLFEVNGTQRCIRRYDKGRRHGYVSISLPLSGLQRGVTQTLHIADMEKAGSARIVV